MSGEDLVGLPAEQEGIGSRERLADDLHHVVAEVGDEPTTVLKVAASVFVGRAGSLHDTVQGKEGGQGEFASGCHRFISSIGSG
jgi:hypothetical protein